MRFDARAHSTGVTMRLMAEYNPDQRRHPAGAPDSRGGQWAASNIGDASVWEAAEAGGYLSGDVGDEINFIRFVNDGKSRRVLDAIGAVDREKMRDEIVAALPKLKRERTAARRPVKYEIRELKRRGYAVAYEIRKDVVDQLKKKHEDHMAKMRQQIEEKSPGLAGAEAAVLRHERMIRILDQHRTYEGYQVKEQKARERSVRRANPELRKRLREAASAVAAANEAYREAYAAIEGSYPSRYDTLPESEDDVESLMRRLAGDGG